VKRFVLELVVEVTEGERVVVWFSESEGFQRIISYSRSASYDLVCDLGSFKMTYFIRDIQGPGQVPTISSPVVRDIIKPYLPS
jgi:hypothetical protein